MELIIFDMDGLMFDSEAVAARAFLEVGKKRGYDVDMPMYITLVGLDARSTCEKYREYFGEDVDAEALYEEVGNRISEIVEDEGVPVKPGLLSLLDQIDEMGVKKVVASGSDRERILGFLEQVGIKDRFDNIISSEQVSRGKPDPEVFLVSCEKMNVKPENALVLEDSCFGIEAASCAGIPVIAVPDMIPIPEELKKKCVAVKDSLKDVDLQEI